MFRVGSFSWVWKGSKENWIDFAIIGGGLALGILGLRLVGSDAYWNDLSQTSSSGESVGFVQRGAGAVRHRPSGSWVWRDLATKEKIKLGEGDTIFTGADGSAQVLLQEGGATLTISPNSLITLKKEQKEQKNWWRGWAKLLAPEGVQTKVEVASGQIKVQLGKGARALSIASKDKTYRVESGAKQSQVEFKMSENQPTQVQILNQGVGKPDIKVQESVGEEWDEVFLSTPSEMARTDSTEELGRAPSSVDSGAQLPIQGLQVIFPKKGQVINYASLNPEGKAPLSLQWESVSSSSPDIRALVEWRSQEGQENSEEKGSVLGFPEDRSHAIQVAPGNYQWRVSLTDLDGKSTEAEWQPFTVVYLPPPELVSPDPDAVVSATYVDGASVQFNWNRIKGKSIDSELEISDSAGVSLKVHSKGQELVQFLRPGEYFWKVRVGNSENGGVFSPWSETRKIRVGSISPSLPFAMMTKNTEIFDADAFDLNDVPEEEPPPSPKAIVPTLKLASKSLSTRLKRIEDLDEVSVKLEWTPIPGAKEYQVDIFKPGKNDPDIEKTKEPFLAFKMDPNGEASYSYRITTVWVDGQAISSNTVPLKLNLASPVLKLPKDEAKKKADEDFTLTWERTLFTEHYEIMIARDEKFRKVIEKAEAKDNFFAINYSKPGKYFWRVKSVGKTRASQWSEAREFIIKK